MRTLDNFVLAHTIGVLVCVHRFLVLLSQIFKRKLDVRSYNTSDSLKINLELKGPIQCLKTPGNHLFELLT